MRKLDKRLSNIRNKLLIELWEANKAELTLKELGAIFGLGITTTWEILQKSPNYVKKDYYRTPSLLG